MTEHFTPYVDEHYAGKVRSERFSALPTIGYAMYAPELKANSDEMKIGVSD